jgi:hypothetical protein
MRARQIAQGLGWFSLALGAAELLAPTRLGRSMGLDKPNLIRGYGLREIVAGAMILTRPRDAGAGVWTRVADDVLDLGALAMARPTGRQKWVHRAVLAFVAGALAADAWTGWKLRHGAVKQARKAWPHVSGWVQGAAGVAAPVVQSPPQPRRSSI